MQRIGAGRAATISALTAAIALVPAALARAATIDVTITADTVADDSECSLREAVTATNLNADVVAPDCDHDGGTGADTIELADPATSTTYVLGGSPSENANAGGDLDIEAGPGLTIRGDGAGQTTIDGGNVDRVLHLEQGALALEDLTIEDGDVAAADGGGGGILSGANSLTLTRANVISNESADEGGGIRAAGNLNVTDSVIAANVATVSVFYGLTGGGIYSQGTATISDSVIGGNSVVVNDDPGLGTTVGGAGIAQAGIAQIEGSMTITDSTVQVNTVAVDNSQDFPSGGGISISDADLIVRRSVVQGNSTTGGNVRSGAGIFFLDGATDNIATIENTTVSSNNAGPASSSGGGIKITRGVTEISSSTFAGNSATSGKAVNYQDSGQAESSVTVRGSIFSEGGTGECVLPSSVLTSDGYNVDAGTSCFPADGTSLFGTDPMLGALDANGGPTQTRALPPESAAIDLLPPAECVDVGGDPLVEDQRGVTRPFRQGCDAGAYERAKCRGAVVGAGALIGTPAAETLEGNGFDNVIVAAGGKDVVKGRGGKDRICGGAGGDTLKGQGGADKLAGENGNDKLAGGTGKDSCKGGAGKDSLNGCE